VGLGDKLKNKPNQLSGGQQQRVSIARALVGRPAIILADEPTGALDRRTGREVLGLLQQLHAQGNTVVLITHDNSIAQQAQRIIRLEDGRVVYDGDAHAPEAMQAPTLPEDAIQTPAFPDEAAGSAESAEPAQSAETPPNAAAKAGGEAPA
jgi:putative ABC transport system ATP-binding protein